MNSLLREHPEILELPRRLRPPYSWVGHIPFAFHLMKIHRPGVFVELGVHTGNSFAAFCQGAELADLRTACFGVDTWRGDEHAGFYEQTVYDELLEDMKKQFSGNAHLLRMPFDEALNSFSDASIDLLHIDGLHTYDAVAHDFYSWLPKLSERGVVLLHDTDVRSEDFGVWKLFEELQQKYPAAQFRHAYGLGVVAVGKKVPDEVLELIAAIDAHVEIRNLFSRVGELTKSLSGLDGEQDISAHIESLHKKIDNLEKMIAEKDSLFHQVVTGKDRLFLELEQHSQAMLEEKEKLIHSMSSELTTLRRAR